MGVRAERIACRGYRRDVPARVFGLDHGYRVDADVGVVPMAETIPACSAAVTKEAADAAEVLDLASMRVLVASDLHFEFHPDRGFALANSLAPADVLVCPGDLAVAPLLGGALGLLLERFAHVVFVAGNHEFYHSSLAAVRQALRRLDAEIEHFHYLEQSECRIEGRRFVGATLWFPRRLGIELLHRFATDFRKITDAMPGIYDENARASRYLESAIDRDTIVVTHHLPHRRSLPPLLAHSPLNRFVLADLAELMEERQPSLWIHGHAHTSSDYYVGNTRTVCNPFGYSGRAENAAFRADYVLDL